jgi:hypothetical protein
MEADLELSDEFKLPPCQLVRRATVGRPHRLPTCLTAGRLGDHPPEAGRRPEL